jgi:hypothetical protein
LKSPEWCRYKNSLQTKVDAEALAIAVGGFKISVKEQPPVRNSFTKVPENLTSIT